MMPFLIHSLGDRMYGIWALVGAFIGYYGLLDLGISSAVARFISRALGKDDHAEMNIIINTSIALFSILGLTVFIISIIIALLSSYFVSHDDVSLIRKIIVILGFSIALGFPMRALRGVLLSTIRYDLSAIVATLKLFVRTALVVILIKKGFGLIALALITLLVDVGGYLITFWQVKSEFSQIKLTPSLFRKERISSLFNYSKYTFLAQLGDQLRFKFDSFVIAGFLDASFVTPYFIGARLIEYFSQFIISSVGMLVPVVSHYEGREDFDSIKKWFMGMTKISVTLSFFVGASLIFYGDVFIERWMGSEYSSSYYVMVILCVGIITDLMQNPSVGLLYGLSKHKYYAVSNGCEAVLNLLLSLVLVQYYGIYGVAMGTLFSMVVLRLFIQPIYTCRAINLSLFEYYWNTIFLTAAKTLLPLSVYFYLITYKLEAQYINILSFAVLQVLLFVPISYFFILNSNERRRVMLAIGVIH